MPAVTRSTIVELRPFFPGIGACHFAEGRLEEAIVHFKAVADIDPSEASLFNLANALGKAERSVAAAEAYRRVLKLNPNRRAAPPLHHPPPPHTHTHHAKRQ
jgi:tetratricopeptide (TPR) repeat protein